VEIPRGLGVTDETKRIVGEITAARSDLRTQPLACLIAMTEEEDQAARTDAIAELLRLCERNFIGRENLLPHEKTLLNLCRAMLHEAEPLQADPQKMEWRADPAYASIRYRTGLLLDVIGYLPIDNAGAVLQSAFSMSDPRLKLIAALSLLRNLEPVGAEELEKIAASHEVRILLWEQLRQLEMESLMPERWKSTDMLAASELSRWIAHPMELGTPPEEIELMETFPVRIDDRVLDLYLFRFREFPKPWDPDDGWKAGIAGLYEDGQFLRSCWSSFESWNTRTPEEHVKKMIAIISGCGDGGSAQ
jgi:hypothetical protein